MDQAVRTLVDAGFQEQDAIAALKRSGGDADEAILLLLGDELTPARVLRQRPAGPDWGGSLPQEVLEVVGRWLNQHLGAFDGRPRLKPVPEYLHPLAINKYRATHSIKEIESGRTRLVATREMLLALRACRQSCRVWRDEIAYRGVTELALDGVLHIGRLSPLKGMYGLPSLEQMASDASRATAQRCPPNVYTWWPGHRTLQCPSRPPQRLSSTRNICHDPTSRCPACRTPQPRTQNRGKYPTLKQFMKDMGIGNWFGAVTELLGITSVAALRQMTTYELMELARKHNYSETQMLEVAPKVIAKVGAGKDWESRKTSEGAWLRTNSQKFAVHTHCDECGLGCLSQSDTEADSSSCPSTSCGTCGLVYCSDCADGIFSDSRPQTVDEILPADFPERFSNLTMLSLCDLELPYLPAMLAQCTSLTSLNASGNCLQSLGSQTNSRAIAEAEASLTDDYPILIDEDDEPPNSNDLIERRSQYTVLPPGLLELDLSGRSQWMDHGSAAATNIARHHQQKRQRQLSFPVGSLPATLRDLRLSNLGLHRVPVALKECTELRTLDLSYNRFVIRRDWTGFLPTADGGVLGGSPWERGDLSAEEWLGELRFLGELNLCKAATVITQGENGQLTLAQIVAATMYFAQRAQLIQQRQQARNALMQAAETLRSNRSQEHAAFKDFEAVTAKVARSKALLSRCDPGDVERWARLDAERAAAEAEEAAVAAQKTHVSEECAAAEAAHAAASQAHQTALTAIANLGPAPVALGAWHAHNQDNLPHLIRDGVPLTEQVLETLFEEHWLRKWSGQLQLVESHED